MGTFSEGVLSQSVAVMLAELAQVMREMGFQYDPSTAGSSVRFDPPDPKDEVRFYLWLVLSVLTLLGIHLVHYFP